VLPDYPLRRSRAPGCARRFADSAAPGVRPPAGPSAARQQGLVHRVRRLGLQALGTRGGNGAATFRTASRPSTLTRFSTTTRMVSMPKHSTGMRLLVFRALGHDQPRDVHGAPHARAKPTAQLMQYERGVCARRTATKYRNTTAATAIKPGWVPPARAQPPISLRLSEVRDEEPLMDDATASSPRYRREPISRGLRRPGRPRRRARASGQR